MLRKCLFSYYFRKFTLLLSVIFLVNNNKENSHLLVKYTLLINMTWSKTFVAKCSAFQNKKTKALSENFKKRKSHSILHYFATLAETEGFEPPIHFCITVFKTAAIDRSAISPLQKYKRLSFVQHFFLKKNKSLVCY